MGTIEKLFVAAKRGEIQQHPEAVRAVAGRGIEGDRNFGKRKWPGQNITFVEAEEIERFIELSGLHVDLSATRRNIVTRGIRLNDLVGREFTVGEARFRGIELCEPCSHLSAGLKSPTTSGSQIVRLLAHRAGLRADILASGTIRIGDAINVEVR